MTLRSAARLGVAGSAMPLAQLVAWFLVASIIGRPIAEMQFHWNLLALAMGYLPPLTILGFLVALYGAAAHRVSPARLGDVALAASVLTLVALAYNLRWEPLSELFRTALEYRGWMSWVPWLVGRAIEPAAWLVFLVTFVRHPAPPVARSSRRAAVGFAVALSLGCLVSAYEFAPALLGFFWDFPPRGPRVYDTWNSTVLGLLQVSGYLLLMVFAVALWRIRPAEPPPESAGSPAHNGS